MCYSQESHQLFHGLQNVHSFTVVTKITVFTEQTDILVEHSITQPINEKKLQETLQCEQHVDHAAILR